MVNFDFSTEYMNNIEWRIFVPSVIFISFIISIFIFNFESNILHLLRTYAVVQWLRPVLFLIPVIIALAYFWADTPGSEESEHILFSGLGEFLNVVFTGTTYGFFISSCYFFLTRYFLQLFFDETFFVEFSNRDLGFIAIILGYVLYWSSMMVYEMASQAFFTGDVGRVITEE